MKLRRHSALIEVSRCEANLVVPVDGEGVEAERLEVVEVLELAADAHLHQQYVDIIPALPSASRRRRGETSGLRP